MAVDVDAPGEVSEMSELGGDDSIAEESADDSSADDSSSSAADVVDGSDKNNR